MTCAPRSPRPRRRSHRCGPPTCAGTPPTPRNCSPPPTSLDEVVARALDSLEPLGHDVMVDIPESLPAVQADPAILERVVVNLIENALRYSPAGKAPLLAASALGDRVELRVVDRGPGIPEKDR